MDPKSLLDWFATTGPGAVNALARNTANSLMSGEEPAYRYNMLPLGEDEAGNTSLAWPQLALPARDVVNATPGFVGNALASFLPFSYGDDNEPQGEVPKAGFNPRGGMGGQAPAPHLDTPQIAKDLYNDWNSVDAWAKGAMNEDGNALQPNKLAGINLGGLAPLGGLAAGGMGMARGAVAGEAERAALPRTLEPSDYLAMNRHMRYYANDPNTWRDHFVKGGINAVRDGSELGILNPSSARVMNDGSFPLMNDEQMYYHGGEAFSDIDMSRVGKIDTLHSGAGPAFYVTPDYAMADGYARRHGGVVSNIAVKKHGIVESMGPEYQKTLSELPLPPDTFFSNSADSAAAPLATNALDNSSQPIRAYRGVDMARPGFGFGKPQSMFASSDPNVAGTYALGGGDYHKGAILPVDMNFSNPMRVDAQGAAWFDIPYRGSLESSESLATIARDAGHDGLILDNVVDSVSKAFRNPATSYAALRPNTVKSATTGETLFSNPDEALTAPLALDALENHLPMDQASRMARARERFDTDRVLYHGTKPNSEITEFDPETFGDSSGGLDGFWFTSNKGQADSFGRMADAFSQRRPFDPQNYSKYRSDILENFGPLPEDLLTVDVDDILQRLIAEGTVDSSATQEVLGPMSQWAKIEMNEAEEAGKKGVVFKNIVDDPLGGYGSKLKADHTVIFDPRNIRSVNAAFDPAKADSANLLASNPKEAAAPLALNSLEQQSPEDTDSLLDRILQGYANQ